MRNPHNEQAHVCILMTLQRIGLTLFMLLCILTVNGTALPVNSLKRFQRSA